jgi:ribosomal protein L7Ae-like RNA K-turn-binding protein
MALRQPVQTPAFADLCCTIDDWLAERLRACVRLACKAGATISGYQALRMACIQKRVLYMILAADSTPIRQEAYRAWCVQQQIPTLVLGTKAALGDLIGKPSRSAIGFTSPHFCTLLGLTLSMQERWHASRLNTK